MRWPFAAALVAAWAVPIAIAILPPRANQYLGQGELVIVHDNGGRLDKYDQKYADLRRAGTKVILDGACISACTMVLKLPRDQVCATKRARLAFHSATYVHGGAWSLDGSLIMWRTYPERVRQILRGLGWRGTNPHPKLIWVRASKLGIASC